MNHEIKAAESGEGCEYRLEREIPFYWRNQQMIRQNSCRLELLLLDGRISNIHELRQYRTEEVAWQAEAAQEMTLKACKDLMSDVTAIAESDQDKPHSAQTHDELRKYIDDSVRALGEALRSSNQVWNRQMALRRMTEDDWGSVETLTSALAQREALSLADSFLQGELTLQELRVQSEKARRET